MLGGMGQRIAELEEGQQVSGTFLVREKQLRPFRNKQGQFLNLVLEDSTGRITGRMWEGAEEAASGFEAGQPVRVEGEVQTYQGTPQLIIREVAPVDPAEVEPEVYPVQPESDRPVEEMVEELRQIRASMEDEYLGKLLDSFLDDEEFMERYSRWPGAKEIHHAYVGGLLEHTLEICKICETVCQIYPQLDRDLLLTGALLHDIGKTEELQTQPTVEYTDRGKLLGHIVIGLEMVADKIDGIEDYPAELKVRTLHMIASHHGEVDANSPRAPMIAEACALHYVENLDAQVNRFVGLVEEARRGGRTWTEYQRTLGRSLYAGSQQEEQ
jgi:3'-5' exoribonuclease